MALHSAPQVCNISCYCMCLILKSTSLYLQNWLSVLHNPVGWKGGCNFKIYIFTPTQLEHFSWIVSSIYQKLEIYLYNQILFSLQLSKGVGAPAQHC